MSGNKGKNVFPIVILSGIVLALICVFLGIKSDNQMLSLIGVGIFFVTVIAGVFIGNGNSKANSVGKISSETEKTALKYEPLLLDERTKQDPEIQRLLQYTSVQKTFFDPEFLKTAEAQSDPQVRELMAVLDNIIITQTANGVYPSLGQGELNGTNAYSHALMQKEMKRREDEKKKPRRIVGAVLTYVGLALFIIPFIVVFSSTMLKGGSSPVTVSVPVFFHIAPIGMILMIVGSIVKK